MDCPPDFGPNTPAKIQAQSDSITVDNRNIVRSYAIGAIITLVTLMSLANANPSKDQATLPSQPSHFEISRFQR